MRNVTREPTPGAAGAFAVLDPDRYGIRINRRLYWAFFIVLFGLDSWGAPDGSWLVTFALAPLWIAVYGARLHDFGRSAWWGVGFEIIGLALIPLLDVAIATLDAAEPENRWSPGLVAAWALMVLAVVWTIGFWIWLGVRRGTPGTNRYGAPVRAWGFTAEQVRDWPAASLLAVAAIAGGLYGWWLFIVDMSSF